MSTRIRTSSARFVSRAFHPLSTLSSRQIALSLLVLLIATLPLGCSTDPGITDPIAAIFEGVTLTTSRSFVPKNGGQSTLTATVISKTGAPLRDVKVVFETTAGELSPGTVVATNEAGVAIATLQTSNRALVSASVGSIKAAATMVDVNSPVDLDIKTPNTAFSGQGTEITIKAKRKDGVLVTGEMEVEFGDGKSIKIAGFVREAIVFHNYSKTGTFTVKAELEQTAGQTEDSSASLTVQQSVGIQVSISANPAFPEVKKKVTFTVTATRDGGGPGRGRLLFDFGDGDLDERTNFDGSTSFAHKYEETGSYRVKAQLTASNGSDDNASTTIEVSEPGNTRVGNDDLDLGQVSFLHANISGWAVTSTITGVSITGSQVCVYHTKAGKWPAKNLSGVVVEGNPWVVVNRDGRWYAGTYEWLRPGQVCKGITAGNIGGHIKQAPLANWRPRSGEQIGFIISTLSRDANRTSNERTNVVLVRWP
jgi:hypothetical protein